MGKETAVFKELTIGTCYYPEHWDPSLWEEDLERMSRMGIRLIRIAEFGWSLMEPREGEYDLSFFDGFLTLCEQKGMKVILGTPTATPPAWLTEKYPEVLNANIEGIAYRHGGRRHYNYNSPVYREKCAGIVEQMASCYGKRACVVGWQIDNELNCETDEFYSKADDEAFRRYLQETYQTIGALNKAWGTAFWSQGYSEWKEVHIPRPVVNHSRNPHQQLDYFRFVSRSVRSFAKLQADIIKKYRKDGDFITTNGLFGNMDNHALTEESLDIYMYDSYPNFAFGLDRKPKEARDLNDRKWTKHLTETRSICPHFGIMEQQSGPGYWTTRMFSPAPRPGQLTLWAMQSIAQGADFVSFFRWRTATIGTEIYWHGILNYDNRDNRRSREVEELAKRLDSMKELAGADVVASFALVKDYDNVWDAQADFSHGQIAKESEQEIFAAAELTHRTMDILYLHDEMGLEELQKYPVLIYPHPTIMTQSRAQLLEEYTAQGGILIIGCRSGYKDQNGHCVMTPQPGLLQKLTGTDVTDFTYVSMAEEPVTGRWGNMEYPLPVYHDILTPLPETEVLARFSGSYYDGEAVLTRHQVGKGFCYHLGSCFSRELTMRLLEEAGAAIPGEAFLDAPKEVETVLRIKDGKQYLFVLNFDREPKVVDLKQNLFDLFANRECKAGKLELPAYGTAVFRSV